MVFSDGGEDRLMTDRARDRADGRVGARALRREDQALLTGEALFVRDLSWPDLTHAVVVRSPIAHGRVTVCDTRAAAAVPGVRAVVTPGDARGLTLPCVALMPGQQASSYPVLSDVVRYVGQPLAVVVADSEEAAWDAHEVIGLEFEQWPAEVEGGAAGHVVADFELGDPAVVCEAQMAGAAHVVDLTFRVGRVAPSPMEPRAVVAWWEGDSLTLWTPTQAPHHVREHVAESLGVPIGAVRVVTPHVGGAFGAKEHIYPDELAVCLAARRVRRPVRWAETRSEHFTSTVAARDVVHRGRLAVDAAGRFLALHDDIVGNLGAHPSNVGGFPLVVGAVMLPGPYVFHRAGARVRAVTTTTTPTGSYRGFGQPEVTWARERLIDEAARRLSVEPVALRLRNMIAADRLPYLTRTGARYDSGDFGAALRTLQERVKGYVPARADGRRRGIGYACHVQSTGMGPSAELRAHGWQGGGFETAVVRMESDASVSVQVGVAAIGQGIHTALAQITADVVGVPLDRVRVQMGDTAAAPYSSVGAIASRSVTVAGAAVRQAAELLGAKVRRIAAHRLGVAVGDVVVTDGAAQAAGVPGARLALEDVALWAWRGWKLPQGCSPGLEERATYDPADFVYAHAAHAAAVAVDPETGAVEVERYWIVADSGVVVNPMIVEGQLRGGAVQGIGMALSELIRYDPDGRPLTTGLGTYDVPTACEAPEFDITLLSTPSPVTPGGMKGAGESGIISAPAAVGNAVAAALTEVSEGLTNTPMTPEYIWQLTQDRPARTTT